MSSGATGTGLRSRTLGILTGVFALACLLGYLVVRDAVNKTVEQQALGIAQIVARQAAVLRSVYAQQISGKPQSDGAAASGHGAVPAHFMQFVGRDAALGADALFDFRPVSPWNLEPTQGLSDDFLRWAWPQLERQNQRPPADPIAWKPVSRFEQQDGRRVLRYLAADPASQTACITCHNAYEKKPSVMALRTASGVTPGREFALHELMGALSITIPLDKAQKVAGQQITQATVFFFAILFVSFLALIWFNWRLGRQRSSLQQARLDLARSELDARSANEQRERAAGRQGGDGAGVLGAVDLHARHRPACAGVGDRPQRPHRAGERQVRGHQRL